MTYGVHLKRAKQRKFHFYDYIEVQYLPQLNEHIKIGEMKYKVIDIVHCFESKVIEGTKFYETEQFGSIYALESNASFRF